MITNFANTYNSDDFIYRHTGTLINTSYPLHNHNVCELLFLKKGEVSYLVEGKNYQLSKNYLVFTRPGDSHAINFSDQTEYERYNILFDEKFLPSKIHHAIPTAIDVVNFNGNSLVCDLFKKMDYYTANFEGNTLKIILRNLTEELLYNVLIASKTQQGPEYTESPLINSALKYIEDNLTSPLTIDSICNELYITKSHLHHLFIEHLKISPKKYIMSKKLTMAQRELRSGSKPTEVYTNCGFAEYSTFYRDYIKFFGCSPSNEAERTIIQEIQA